MIYLDTSVLLPLFLPEPDSTAVRSWFGRNGGEDLAISDWTLVEFSSALGIKVREKHLRPESARAAAELMSQLATDSLEVLTPTRPDYRRAAEILGQHSLGLRAGDALHLAIAANRSAARVVSLDRRFVAAGLKLNMRTASPI